jgi:ATP-binding cassette subfamily F protein uup
MRLLMAEPNVLLLDEPTNDLDIDTLTALEDLLDAWPGTLVVVSHDRYFVERVCDNVHALTPDGAIRHLPRGIEQYLEERHDGAAPGPASDGNGRAEPAAAAASAAARRPKPSGAAPAGGAPAGGAPAGGAPAGGAPAGGAPAGRARAGGAPAGRARAGGAPAGAILRAARKEVARLERALEALAAREAALHEQMAIEATDHLRLRVLQAELATLVAEREALEAAWMDAAEALEG